MKNNTLIEIYKARADLTDYVFHFTKEHQAKQTLIKILEDGIIKDINQNGYVCFSESPITHLPKMFNIFKRWWDPYYAPYGIGVKKEFLYKMGGRPVIYGDKSDKAILPKSWEWRFVYLNYEKNDFSWLREWRIPKSEIKIDVENFIIITDKIKDFYELPEHLFELQEIDIEGEPSDGGFSSYVTSKWESEYKFISMEEIEKVNAMNKQEFEELINKDNFTKEITLGSH